MQCLAHCNLIEANCKSLKPESTFIPVIHLIMCCKIQSNSKWALIRTFKWNIKHLSSSRGCGTTICKCWGKKIGSMLRALLNKRSPKLKKLEFFKTSNFDNLQFCSFLSCKDAEYLIWKQNQIPIAFCFVKKWQYFKDFFPLLYIQLRKMSMNHLLNKLYEILLALWIGGLELSKEVLSVSER